MSEESTDIKIEQPLDQAALNEEAAKELEAMVAAEQLTRKLRIPAMQVRYIRCRVLPNAQASSRP